MDSHASSVEGRNTSNRYDLQPFYRIYPAGMLLTMLLRSVTLALPNSAFLFRSLRLELGVEKAFF